jgi:phenylalanyl-tRNA synthetase beta chain
MLIETKALKQELPALEGLDANALCGLLAGLGLPVDGVEGTVLDVDVTANRGDVMSQRGMARDLAAKVGAALAPLPRRILAGTEGVLPVRLEAGEAAPFYATAVLELGRTSGTPEPVRAFLAAMGSTAKGLAPVDASNELLHRYGHPTHAFDFDKVRGALVVRWAREGETLVTLDGETRHLSAQDLVIADEAAVIALAGVMGGESTKVTEGTRRVLLESAWFAPRVVRAMARRHNLHTDASHRFGRGADPAMAVPARDLLAARLEDWAQARLVAVWSAGALPPDPAPVRLASAMLDRVAGRALDFREAGRLLERLGCRVVLGLEGLSLEAAVPTWRFDLAIPEDLAEEVLRLQGFEHIPSALPPLEGAPEPLSPEYLKRRSLSARLAHLGFFQTVTYGFGDLQEGASVHAKGDPELYRTLRNPLGEAFSLMRGTLLRELGDVARLNLARGAAEVRLFELAPVFEACPGDPAGPVRETWTLALLWAGRSGGEDPLSPPRRLAEPEGRAFLAGVLKDLGLPDGSGFTRWEVPGADGEVVGWQYEIPLSAVPDAGARVIPPFVPFSRHPQAERDLSLLVALDQPYRPLAAAMAAAVAPAPLLDLRCVDVFRHKSLPAGRQAWLMRLRFQSLDRTLTGEEVDRWVAAALTAARSLGAELRG